MRDICEKPTDYTNSNNLSNQILANIPLIPLTKLLQTEEEWFTWRDARNVQESKRDVIHHLTT